MKLIKGVPQMYVEAIVARFFLVKHIKAGKYIPNDQKYTKWP
jgi:hypothetical protein